MGRLARCGTVCLRSNHLLMETYECRYYQRLDNGRVECQLCPHHCRIAEGKRGLCRSRRNQRGVLVSDVYGKPCAVAIDPIEKKPLYHFHPGTSCLSIACTGCNFRCLNCQNHDISQVFPKQVDCYDLSPESVGLTSNTSPTRLGWHTRTASGTSSSRQVMCVRNRWQTCCPTLTPLTST